MLKVTQYALHPGACYFCHNPRLPGIDTLVDEETPVRSTRIYVCHVCAMNMASLVATLAGKRIVDFEEYAEVLRRLESTAKELEENRVMAEMFRATLQGIAVATEEKFGVTIGEAIETMEEEARAEVQS